MSEQLSSKSHTMNVASINVMTIILCLQCFSDVTTVNANACITDVYALHSKLQLYKPHVGKA